MPGAPVMIEQEIPDPLRERIPIYLRVFLIGVAASVAVALPLWLLTRLPALVGRETALLVLRPLFGEGAGGVAWGPLMGIVAAVGYALVALGTLLLLVGGARGGGYTNIGVGALEAVVGGRNRTHDDFEGDAAQRRGEVMRARDPMERLRRGLRPKANPTAFWQAVAGIAYLLLGIAAIATGSA